MPILHWGGRKDMYLILVFLMINFFSQARGEVQNIPCSNTLKVSEEIGDVAQKIQEIKNILPNQSCLALDTAHIVYKMSSGKMIDTKITLGPSPTQWIDCDWTENTLITKVKEYEKDGMNHWWDDMIDVCQKLERPKGYKISKIYAGTRGTQAVLYRSLTGGPVLLAFAGTQDEDDIKTAVNSGEPQISEFTSFRNNFDEEAEWHLLNDSGGKRGNLNYKFRLKTNDFSETILFQLAKQVANNEDLIITGHSLGGGLAQSFAYIIQAQAELLKSSDKQKTGQISVYTWNGMGGLEGLSNFLKNKKIGLPKKDIINKLKIENYYVEGDLIVGLRTQLNGQSIKIPNPGSIVTTIKNLWKDPLKPHRLETLRDLYIPQHCFSSK